ncbi:MAG: hypothetical protein ABSF99_08335 [Anaerolineales bacterium]|jgi:hypothetical protein
MAFIEFFSYTSDDIRKSMPVYGQYVDQVIVRKCRQHPLVKTQCFYETIDSQAGMVPPARQALLHGAGAAHTEPEPGKTYAFLIDFASQALFPGA